MRDVDLVDEVLMQSRLASAQRATTVLHSMHTRVSMHGGNDRFLPLNCLLFYLCFQIMFTPTLLYSRTRSIVLSTPKRKMNVLRLGV